MFNDLKAITIRSSATLLEDFAGAFALVVMLVIALHLPGVF